MSKYIETIEYRLVHINPLHQFTVDVFVSLQLDWHQTDKTSIKNLSCIVTQNARVIIQSKHDKTLERRSYVALFV